MDGKLAGERRGDAFRRSTLFTAAPDEAGGAIELVYPVGSTVEDEDLAVDFANHDGVVASNRHTHDATFPNEPCNLSTTGSVRAFDVLQTISDHEK